MTNTARQQEIAKIAAETGVAGGRPTVKQATGFLIRYLDTSADWARVPRGKFLWVRRDGQKRWRLKARVLEIERQGSDGTWHKVSSGPLIDIALRLSGLGGEEAKESAVQSLARRKEEKAGRQQEAADQRRKDGLDLLALKALDSLDPALFRSAAIKGRQPDDRDGHLRGLLAREHERLALQLAGKPLPERDEWVTSLDRPPWLPFVRDVRYQWVQPIGDTAMAVLLEGREGNVHVHLMATRTPDFLVNPLTLAFTVGRAFWKPDEIPVPHGYVSGVVRVANGEPVAQLTFIQTAAKRQGSGRWLIRQWCRLLKGWGVQRFIVFRPRDEGRPFFERLIEKDELVLHGGDGDSLLVSCRPGRTANLPFTTGGAMTELTSGDLDRHAALLSLSLRKAGALPLAQQVTEAMGSPPNLQFLAEVLEETFEQAVPRAHERLRSPFHEPDWEPYVRWWLGRYAAQRLGYRPDWTEFPEAVAIHRAVSAAPSIEALTSGTYRVPRQRTLGEVRPDLFRQWVRQGAASVGELATDAAEYVADMERMTLPVDDPPMSVDGFIRDLSGIGHSLREAANRLQPVVAWIARGRQVLGHVEAWRREQGLTRAEADRAIARVLAVPETKERGMRWKAGLSALEAVQAAWLYEAGNYGEWDEGRTMLQDAEAWLPER